jgi:Divergent InlB B-repeat domain
MRRHGGSSRVAAGAILLLITFSIWKSAAADFNLGIKIALPVARQRIAKPGFTIRGKTGPHANIESVFFQLNDADWASATTTNHWATWFANVQLAPGPNVLCAYAVDSQGAHSPTNTVKFTYVARAVLTVQRVGPGRAIPDYDGRMLEIGRTYRMTAKPGKGFSFLNWMGSTNATSETLTFVMNSNLTFIANFQDVSRPTIAIT